MGGILSGNLGQSLDDRLELPGELIVATQGCDSALLYAPLVVPIGLDQLHVTATSRVGELDRHAATITLAHTL